MLSVPEIQPNRILGKDLFYTVSPLDEYNVLWIQQNIFKIKRSKMLRAFQAVRIHMENVRK